MNPTKTPYVLPAKFYPEQLPSTKPFYTDNQLIQLLHMKNYKHRRFARKIYRKKLPLKFCVPENSQSTQNSTGSFFPSILNLETGQIICTDPVKNRRSFTQREKIEHIYLHQQTSCSTFDHTHLMFMDANANGNQTRFPALLEEIPYTTMTIFRTGIGVCSGVIRTEKLLLTTILFRLKFANAKLPPKNLRKFAVVSVFTITQNWVISLKMEPISCAVLYRFNSFCSYNPQAFVAVTIRPKEWKNPYNSVSLDRVTILAFGRGSVIMSGLPDLIRVKPLVDLLLQKLKPYITRQPHENPKIRHQLRLWWFSLSQEQLRQLIPSLRKICAY